MADGVWRVGDLSGAEHQQISARVAFDPARGRARVYAVRLPPGARFVNDTLLWIPDFVQGGRDWPVEFVARTTTGAMTSTVATLRVADTIRPPPPEIVGRQVHDDHVHLAVVQTTDDFLDAPAFAGRGLRATVSMPTATVSARSLAVQLRLHGFDGHPRALEPEGRIIVEPSDPQNTYWWGYAVTLPHRPKTAVPNYSQRRALHLLQWVLETWPAADPERVAVAGASMGGTGALAIGLQHGRHFAAVESKSGQVIARNHRPYRIAQLSKLWGKPRRNLSDGDPLAPLGVWDRLDLVRMLRDRPEARAQYIFNRHGKDDTTIHFGATVRPSRAVGLSFYEALQTLRIGHYVVWDEGGHVSPDPVMGERWWDSGWDRLSDARAFLRRNLAFPAFTRSSADEQPGDGRGTGARRWNKNRGYAGRWSTAGDTGWTGDWAGVRNRYLRWDSRSIIDRWDRFEIPLFVHHGAGEPAPDDDHPPKGDLLQVDLPIVVDVTPRRRQAFHTRPGEEIRWRFGAQSGVAQADRTGAVTIPRLAVIDRPSVLVLQRGGTPTPATTEACRSD